ncbi:alpha/beta hydrolase [Pusillimonas sp. CC-YST705]|uniref:Alpha/beta hydrolase n=1 Tax=Mesopusillimonas faecipullorum TaxID=2755040 RepID=A0ABS8CDZ7_9BURK|nr:alpha/beta hydrolase [Mesopusillimonas faecipullorum]MCB5364270.1 alpha/beta hydrolase [Mesopusillimonas faecipullorum]
MGPYVFRDYDQQALDRAFDQTAWASNGEAVLRDFYEAGQRVLAAGEHHDGLRYGEGPDETLHWFAANTDAAPIHLHIHGGAWRMLRKEDVAFAGPAFTQAGMHLVLPDFSALPGVRLPDVVLQLVRAVSWVYRNVGRYGGDRNRIYLSGHSSGAHVCAVLLTTDWTQHGLPADVIKGGLCVSGIYDMEPVMLSARRHYVHLLPEEWHRLSPIEHAASLNCPLSLVYAEGDSPEFCRQALHFYDTLLAHGKQVDLTVLPKLNHYEIIGELAPLALSCKAFNSYS